MVKNSFQTKIPQTPFAFFWYITRPLRWWMAVAVFFVTVAVALDMGATYIFKLIVDAVEVQDYDRALWYALAYPAVVLIIQLLYRMSGYAGGNLVVRTTKKNFDILAEHTIKHSHSYFINRMAGSLASKIQNIVDATEEVIQNMLWSHLIALVSLLVTLGFILSIDVQSGLLFLGLIVVLGVLNYKLSARKIRLSKAAAESSSALRGQLIDVLGNMQTVRQFVRSHTEKGTIQDLSTSYQQTHLKSWLYSEKMLLINGFVLFFFSFWMFWSLVAGWRDGDVSTGELVLVLALYAQITGVLLFLGRAFDQTARSIGQASEGLQELLLPFEVIDAEDAKPLVVSEGKIDWRNVNFTFGSQAFFTDLNIHISAGQRLGLVGQSGAGKTTFVSLLLRQHELGAGSITIDGQDIAQVTQDSLRQAIAVVPQEPALFHRSIRENIMYGNPFATEEEMIEVARKAQAHDFIMELPEAYDTLVGERGVKLSGGQKQRVAIARAMLKDAPILVLDEATSALDSESEVAIQRALEVLMEGRTVIAIAHRLSTLRKMDRIIVMENGQIIEDGSHEQLSESGGVYARLWNHQAGGFLQDE
jgi:ATP-binding cassette, subfamily B, bacterial